MSPEATIVDCGPFYAVGFLRTIDKSEFSHSLDPKQPFPLTVNPSPRSEPRSRRQLALEWDENLPRLASLGERCRMRAGR